MHMTQIKGKLGSHTSQQLRNHTAALEDGETTDVSLMLYHSNLNGNKLMSNYEISNA